VIVEVVEFLANAPLLRGRVDLTELLDSGERVRVDLVMMAGLGAGAGRRRPMPPERRGPAR
jgi:hypothetical protein